VDRSVARHPRNIEGVNDADAGDLDGDGRLDIVAISAFGGGFVTLYQDPDGSWVPVLDNGLPPVGSAWRVLLLDVNGDDRLDVVSTFNPTTENRRVAPPPPSKVFLQSADGRFVPATGFPPEGRWFGVAVLPRRDSEVPDLIFGLFGERAGLRLYTSETGEHWTDLGRLDEPWYSERIIGFTGITLADMNRDGCQDLVAIEALTRKVWIAVGDCADRWHLCPAETVPGAHPRAQGWGITTGDLNADGRLDIVAAFGTSSDGAIMAWTQVPPDKAPVVPVPAGQGQGTIPSKALRGSGSPELKPEP
jgi:hypothetical protein